MHTSFVYTFTKLDDRGIPTMYPKSNIPQVVGHQTIYYARATYAYMSLIKVDSRVCRTIPAWNALREDLAPWQTQDSSDKSQLTQTDPRDVGRSG